MSFLTRSALLAGNSLKNGAKVSVKVEHCIKFDEMSFEFIKKNESEMIPRKKKKIE